MTLNWTNPTGGATLTDTSYRYKPKSDTESGYTDWTDIGSVATSKEVANLTNGVEYTFQVRAKNATGNGTASDEASAWTYPAAPSGLAAAPGDKLVSLTWDDPGKQQHHALRIPAEDRRQLGQHLDSHDQQQRYHYAVRGEVAEQRYGVHLPHPGL